MTHTALPVAQHCLALVFFVGAPAAEPADQHRARGVLVRVQPNGSRLEKLAELFDEGFLKVLIGPRFELAAAREAHRVSQSGHAHGKVVLDVS